MGAPRTAAGHAAAKLKAALLAKIGGSNDEELLRAANLCDRYLNSCNNTEAGLEVLKGEVKKILSGQDPKTVRARKAAAVPLSRTSSRQSGGPRPAAAPAPPAALTAQTSKRDDTPPWLLPSIRMQGRAHAMGNNPYNRIAHGLASAEMTDDEIRHKNKRERAQHTRSLLDSQMKEVNAQRAEDAAQRRRDKEESDRKIREYWQAEEDTRRADLAHALKIKADRESQVAQRMHAAAEERARMTKEAAVERARQAEEQQREKAEKMAQRRKHQEFLRKAAEENKARLKAKAEQQAKEHEENRQLALLQMKMAEERDERRQAELEALREAILAKYRAAGGEARELDLAAKAKAAAEKAAKEAAERDQRIEDDLRRRKMEQKERTDQQMRTLQMQLDEQERQRQAELAEKQRLREEMQLQSAQRKAREKAAKEKTAEDNRLEILRLKAEMEEEGKRRYDELTEQMGYKEEAAHKHVLMGTTKPFHYFKAVNPST